ncbi:meiotic recombination protein SPO11-2 [Magnolia sinica]|uniref:meiotic recombination protein SPO11-2 n=1 Tax=Magnolia sinica TaxID=86752 RepID=UPI002658C1D5|nr:meiotic recombination protein SPO11-2 [Magnolia sinica]
MEEEEDLCKSSLFYSDQLLCYAEILPPSQVRARIEVAVLKFLKILTSPAPAVTDLSLINRSLNNSHMRRGLLSHVPSIFLSHSFCTRSLMRAHDAKAFIRVWKVMELCFQILIQEKQVTQRELFYKLLCDSPDYFTSQRQVNGTVQDVIALLRCSRQSLGIMASSRGTVVGRLLLQEPNQEMVDCSVLGSSGYAITGDLNLLNKLVIQSDARYIIVVEKDAIFQRLAEDCIFNQVPSILITAKGYPDIATRFLLHRLSTEFPELPILGLVDWNPAGLAILCTYKFGSIGMGLEAYRYACDVKWLGLRGDDLKLVHQHSFVLLKPRDLQIAKSMMSSEILQDTYRAELTSMLQSGQRVEIEALYTHGYDFLAKYIVRKIVQADYI